MISRDMYFVLKMIPSAPGRITFKDLLGTDKKRNERINEIYSILEDAKTRRYIAFTSGSPDNKIAKSAFYLTEEGKIGLEEYKHRKLDSRRSLWAIVISIIGLIISTTIGVISMLT